MIKSEKKYHELEVQLIKNSSTQSPQIQPSQQFTSIRNTNESIESSFEDKIEITRLEGRIKYYEKEQQDHRYQLEEMSEKIMKYNIDINDYKNRLSIKEKELLDEKQKSLELNEKVKNLELKISELKKIKENDYQILTSSSSPRPISIPIPPLSSSLLQQQQQQQSSSPSPGYFDETESTIGPDENDYKFLDKNKIQTTRSTRYHLSQYERSATESIACILVEELERGGLILKKQLKNKESIYDISVKVALRLLHIASENNSKEFSGYSLNEILSDQRFLNELITDTQVIIIICYYFLLF